MMKLTDRQSRRLEFIDSCIKIRENLGLRKVDVARAYGINKSAITRFEQGKYNSLDLYTFYMELEDYVNDSTRASKFKLE